MGRSFVKSCSWSVLYNLYREREREREREFPLLYVVYKRAFFRSSLFVKLDFSILSQKKKKKA